MLSSFPVKCIAQSRRTIVSKQREVGWPLKALSAATPCARRLMSRPFTGPMRSLKPLASISVCNVDGKEPGLLAMFKSYDSFLVAHSAPEATGHCVTDESKQRSCVTIYLQLPVIRLTAS